MIISLWSVLSEYRKVAKEKVARLQVRQIEVVGLGRIFCGKGVNLVDGRYDAEFLTPFADGETGLLHLHALLQAYGTAYLEVGEAVDFGGVQQLEDFG